MAGESKFSHWLGERKKARDDLTAETHRLAAMRTAQLHPTSKASPTAEGAESSRSKRVQGVEKAKGGAAAEGKEEALGLEGKERRRRRKVRWGPWVERMMGISAAT